MLATLKCVLLGEGREGGAWGEWGAVSRWVPLPAPAHHCLALRLLWARCRFLFPRP